jgi:hydrogenase maturation protease HycI
VAVLGIGHELRGDDAAGVMVVRGLSGRENRAGRETLLLIDAGTAPENHTGALRRFQPGLVLLIDAAQMNLAPGEIRAFDAAALDSGMIDGFSASTHTLPLSLVTQYVTAELGADVLLIGIQPGDMAFGAALSPDVRRAVADVRRVLRAAINAAP